MEKMVPWRNGLGVFSVKIIVTGKDFCLVPFASDMLIKMQTFRLRQTSLFKAMPPAFLKATSLSPFSFPYYPLPLW
jgi:hypothetical protein